MPNTGTTCRTSGCRAAPADRGSLVGQRCASPHAGRAHGRTRSTGRRPRGAARPGDRAGLGLPEDRDPSAIGRRADPGVRRDRPAADVGLGWSTSVMSAPDQDPGSGRRPETPARLVTGPYDATRCDLPEDSPPTAVGTPALPGLRFVLRPRALRVSVRHLVRLDRHVVLLVVVKPPGTRISSDSAAGGWHSRRSRAP